jgi:hypothetical protein
VIDKTHIERRKIIEKFFTQTIDALPSECCDVEFVPRWGGNEVIHGRYTTKGFWGEDRLWNEFWDVSWWRAINDKDEKT